MNIVIINLIEINVIDKFLKRIFVNEMLIDNLFQIMKDTFNNNIMSFDKIENVSKDY